MPSTILIVEDLGAIHMSLRYWLRSMFPQAYLTEATSGYEQSVCLVIDEATGRMSIQENLHDSQQGDGQM